METSGETIGNPLDKYNYLFDILGSQSTCRKTEGKEKESNNTEFKVQSLGLKDFALFPNPTSHSISLRFKTEPGELDIFINNTVGKLIFHEKIPEFNGSYDKLIDLSHNSNGLLILSIAQNGNVFAEQIYFNQN